LSLKAICKKKRIDTLTALSEKTGLTVDYLSKLNTGRRKNPSRDVMEKIAIALGITLDELNDSLKN
jgi:putative transcriptional regulator